MDSGDISGACCVHQVCKYRYSYNDQKADRGVQGAGALRGGGFFFSSNFVVPKVIFTLH